MVSVCAASQLHAEEAPEQLKLATEIRMATGYLVGSVLFWPFNELAYGNEDPKLAGALTQAPSKSLAIRATRLTTPLISSGSKSVLR